MPQFMDNNKELYVSDYRYLAITFSYNGKGNLCKKKKNL